MIVTTENCATSFSQNGQYFSLPQETLEWRRGTSGAVGGVHSSFADCGFVEGPGTFYFFPWNRAGGVNTLGNLWSKQFKEFYTKWKSIKSLLRTFEWNVINSLKQKFEWMLWQSDWLKRHSVAFFLIIVVGVRAITNLLISVWIIRGAFFFFTHLSFVFCGNTGWRLNRNWEASLFKWINKSVLHIQDGCSSLHLGHILWQWAAFKNI